MGTRMLTAVPRCLMADPLGSAPAQNRTDSIYLYTASPLNSRAFYRVAKTSIVLIVVASSTQITTYWTLIC